MTLPNRCAPEKTDNATRKQFYKWDKQLTLFIQQRFLNNSPVIKQHFKDQVTGGVHVNNDNSKRKPYPFTGSATPNGLQQGVDLQTDW
ncbi:hypothetical protein Xcab_04357 [Xenorhabdus cabanillasii JM26]|nr:hypothetical protein Xcab_04357 [Xenorhabdus cabanillasii JM26]